MDDKTHIRIRKSLARGSSQSLSCGVYRSCCNTCFFKLLFQHFAAYKSADRRCNDNSSKHGNQDAGICSCLHGVDVTLFSSVSQHGLRPAVGVNKEHDI